ncbi:hypothetical protein HMPREF3188_00047 [Tissierellia bacterium KA00581]|nr:hypothetical protein HMPREF3188_00047 [Tissierellia bacterium KA00581]
MNIFDRIKNRRKELNMSQEELAIKTGYKTKSAISRIENGNRDISQSQIKIFAKALNTTPEYLMGLKTEFSQPPIDFNHLTKEELEEVAKENHIPYTKIDYIDQPLYCSSPDVDMLEYEEHNTVIMSDNLLKGIKNKNKLMLAKATGDSMDEIIPDGSFVIIQRVEPYDNIQNHDIVLYNYENSLSIKEFIRDENGLIMRPHSTNPIHKDNIYSFENLKENPLFIIGIIKKVIYDI